MYSATVIGPVANIFADNCLDSDSVLLAFASATNLLFTSDDVNDGLFIGLYEQHRNVAFETELCLQIRYTDCMAQFL